MFRLWTFFDILCRNEKEKELDGKIPIGLFSMREGKERASRARY